MKEKNLKRVIQMIHNVKREGGSNLEFISSTLMDVQPLLLQICSCRMDYLTTLQRGNDEYSNQLHTKIYIPIPYKRALALDIVRYT